MGLRDGIMKQMAEAAKAGDKLRLSTVRLLLSAVKYKEVDLKRELTDEEVSAVASTLIRQRHDSIEQFRAGKREDLAQKEEEEIKILQGYLPPQLSPDEVRGLIKKTATEIGAQGMKDMGKLMKEVMPKLKGKAEGKLINDMVKEVLGG